MEITGLFSLPPEVRQMIHFHLLTLIFKSHYDTDSGRYLISIACGFNHGRTYKTNQLVNAICVSRQMQSDIEAVLYNRFSLSFKSESRLQRIADTIKRRFGERPRSLVRNVALPCFVHASSYGLSAYAHEIVLREFLQIATALPGLTRVDLWIASLSTYSTALVERTVAILQVFEDVSSLTLHLGPPFGMLKAELEKRIGRRGFRVRSRQTAAGNSTYLGRYLGSL
jgi:hypothetical protein